MMKLSTMKRVVDTVGEQWESPLAEAILEQWGYDPGTVKYFRASANFAFVFQREGKYYFLRFNDSSERDLQKIASELAVLEYLREAPLHVARPIKSLNDRYIETVVYEDRTYYAVVFVAIPGDQLDIEEMDHEQFFAWGKALGKLHETLKMLPGELSVERSTWQDHLALARDIFTESEPAALEALKRVELWTKGLSMTQDNYGLIHYDFELDNIVWNEHGASILDFDDCACYWYV
jgi:Ser/Thr protein kinase RdoA (MazF antagonist)